MNSFLYEKVWFFDFTCCAILEEPLFFIDVHLFDRYYVVTSFLKFVEC